MITRTQVLIRRSLRVVAVISQIGLALLAIPVFLVTENPAVALVAFLFIGAIENLGKE
jgi:hypothetical protein